MNRINFSAIILAITSLFSSNVSADEMMYGKMHTNVSHVDWCRNAVIYEVNLRQGTPERSIEGLTKQLPRLKKLGVDILWLMPIHPISKVNRKGELGSYYAVANYKAVNPEFGTMADFKTFVKEAHSLGMKVIIDEVCNHTGCDHQWLETNPDFYVRNENGDIVSPYDWTDTYKLDYTNKLLRDEMLEALKFWVTEADIDGFRCDVAGEVPTDFWDNVSKELNAIKPVFLLAEATKPELLVNAFDADYNWPMKDLFNAIAATKGVNAYAVEKKQNFPQKTALDIDTLLMQQAKQYPQGAIHMNMITNHDLNSWEGTEFERYGKAVDAFAVLTYTLPGIPLIYTGQEVGFNHAFEFFKQDQVPNYAENRFTAFYRKLNNLKHRERALDADERESKMKRYFTHNTDVYVFSRQNGRSQIFVMVNLSNETSDVNFKDEVPNIRGMVNYFTGKTEKLPVKLRPWEYKVYVRE